jgi:hypothetical protein
MADGAQHSAAASSAFHLMYQMLKDIQLGRDAFDKPVNRDYKELPESHIAKYRKNLDESLMNDILRELLAPFNTWLAEDSSSMSDPRTSESRVKTRGFHWRHSKGVRNVVRLFLNVMKMEKRLFRTEKGYYGWVHPMAQQGDRVAKVCGCSQFVVLRAYQNGYQVVGDTQLSGVEVKDMRFEEDEVECLRIF